MWLYVSDLDTSVTESQLYDLFNKQGEVISVRIARDLVTQRSFGYGFIYYANRENARRAFELLNLHVLNGKPLRIAYSPGGVGKIFIKNLDKAIGHHELYHVFSEVGDILSCKIAKDDSGQSKGYGFVLYDSEEGRQSAIEKLNGIVLNGKPVYVEPFCHKNEREMLLEKAKGTNLYVRNLSTSITEEDLKKIFGEFGTISSAAVMKDADGNSKCFGFVNFESADDVARAVESLNGQNIDNNNEWYVAIAQKKSDRELELKLQFENMLYIKNLDDCVGDDKLKELFSPFGIITSCKVMRGSNGISRESAFVAFSTSEEASRALLEMNDKIVFGKPLYVAHAQRKEDRRARWKVQVHPEAVNVGGNQSMRTSLYVSDLELNVTALQLFDLFNQLGQVVSVQVCGDFTTQRSHGYSYVNYSNPEAAGRALEVFNLYPLNGKPIRIRYSHRGAGNIVVKNLDEAIDHGALHDVFSSFGNILSCKVATDDSGQSKGYGFVLYDSEEAAQKAVEKFNGMVLNDKKICVGPFRKKHEREMALEKEKLTNVVEGVDKSQRLNLYIKHLDDSIGDDKLKELFSPFGTITAYKVLRDANGISRKSGFVAFSTPEEASTALVEMNGKMVVSKPLYVAYAERKKDRRVRLQAQFSQMHAVAMVPSVAPCMPIKPPCGLGLGEQIFGGQARPAITLPQGQYPCGRHAGGVPVQQGQQPVPLMQEQAQLSQMCPVAVAPLVSPCMPICSSGGHGLGQQIFHGQAPPAITPRQQQLVPGTRPGQLPIPNFFLPVVQQGQYPGSRHAGGVPVQQGQQPVPLMQEQAQFSRMHPVAVAPLVSPCMPICPSGGSGLGQQMFRGQAPPAVTPPQQQLVPGTRPGQLPIPNFFVPLVHGIHPGGRHAGGVPVQQCQQPVPLMQQQMLPRGQIYHYPTGRGLPDVSMSGVAQGMLSIPYHIIGGMPLRDGGISQPTPIGSLAFALSNFSPADQRTMLG
ncbi:polyadenylate-binding protein 2-like [Camellia sinensis]|uniref:polyadenylate-binding protein 2-like n=1 Tax=Camellia sinensis TaxID=4442 RepID=UPI0010369839|nr:polyadenylate-binding protein 2-like [Camellia sinensis]